MPELAAHWREHAAPLELCQWEGLAALPPVGDKYQQHYELVKDRLPKGKQRLHRAAEYRRGLEARARNNAYALVVYTAVSLVMCRPRGAGQRRGRVVLVDEHRTTRVSSEVNDKQPCEEELNKLSATRPAGWKPLAGQAEQRLAPCSSQAATPAAVSKPGPSTPPPAKRSKRTKAEQAAEPTQPSKGTGKAVKAKPAPQPGRWLDKDCNAALNMQRIGESRWRTLELCYCQSRELYQPRARSTLAWAASGCETSHPRPRSSSLLWHSSVCPSI
ncbi:hypothetical protein QJQ45_005239 [Haematococcus lacustris]|nr:hypothetical protein QJQ45_005239 [Haematococcus lacustris]